MSSQDVVTVVLILVFLLIIVYLTREDKGKGKKIVRFKSVPVYEGEE
jgi:hypothetical protein